MVDLSDEDHPLAYTCRPIRQVKRMARFCCLPPALPTAIKLAKLVEAQAPIVRMDEATNEEDKAMDEQDETTELSVATIVATEHSVTSTATTTTATAALVVLSTSTAF